MKVKVLNSTFRDPQFVDETVSRVYGKIKAFEDAEG